MTYPLLPYSQLVLELMDEVPDVYETTIHLRVNASEADCGRLEAALRAVIRNHPVFSMKLDPDGHHPIVLADELHGPYHDINISEESGFILASLKFNRILGDMTSFSIFAEDLSRAYAGLELEKDRYEDYLKKYWAGSNSQRHAELKKWFDEQFGTLSCPVRPHTDTPLDSQEFQYTDILTDSIPFSETTLHKEHVTSSGFVSLCAALAVMDYESTDAAALTWAYSGRDTLEVQRIFGSLHKDIPFVVRCSDSPEELFRQTRDQLRSGIAHSDCPYTMTHPHTEVWNYALNVLHQPDIATILSSLPFKVEMFDEDADSRQVAYSLLDIEFLETGEDSLDLLYRYSAAHYRKESMERFASLVRANAEWLLGGHHRVTRRLEEMLSKDSRLADCVRHTLEKAAERCPDRRFNPVRSLEDLFSFLDRFLVSKPWESLGLDEEISLFRRIDQSTGYFLYLFDQPLEELEGRGYLYPSIQYIPEIASWIKDFNNAWREYLDSPSSWDASCLELVASDPLFGMKLGWYESPKHWRCWNDFFSRRLSGPSARPPGPAAVVAPADGILQEAWDISDAGRLAVPEGVCLKTSSVLNVSDLLVDSPYRESFAGGFLVHQMLDFYDYHRFHSPVDGTVLDVRTIEGISGSGGVVVWNRDRGRYEYANPGEPGFQMLETRGVAVIDNGSSGLVAVVAVGMAQVCSVNWSSGIEAGASIQKGDELGHFLCGGSDVVLLFQKKVNLQLLSEPGRHMLMGESLCEMK